MSCVLEDFHLELSGVEHDGHFDEAYVDVFLGDIKMFFIGGLVNPRTNMGQRYFQKFILICIKAKLLGFLWT